MNAIYLETSALLTWLLGERRSRDVRAAADGADLIVTSSLTFAEADRVLVRSESSRLLRPAETQRLRGMVRRARKGWMTMAVTEDVLARAGKPFPVEPVRTPDAIHLASALAFVEALPDLTLLSFDERLCANGAALGIATRG